MTPYHFSPLPRPVPRVQTAHRSIQTAIPAPGTAEVLARLSAVESRSMHGGLPIVWANAYDYQVEDLGQNEFIDFTSGIFVANVGHANEEVAQAVIAHADNSYLHSYTYATEIRARYLEALTKWSGFEKGFLLSSGSEATEHALRLMKLHGIKTGKPTTGILTIEGNYHGRTLGAAIMSGTAKNWAGRDSSFVHHALPFPSPWVYPGDDGAMLFNTWIRTLKIDPLHLCGVMLESYQGWGAVFYPDGYVQAVAKFCKDHDILLCFDEMQAGFGRTGKKWGFEHYGVTPDLICVGKAMGGGVPLSGVIGRAEILDLPETGSIASTHGGNPMACAAGLAVLDEMDRLDLAAESERKGGVLHAALSDLKAHSSVTQVLGKGLVAAVHFHSAEFASRVAERCMEKGLLVVHTGRETVKIGPPLTIPDSALLEGVAVLGEAIGEIGK